MALRPAAAEDLAGREVVAALDVVAEQIVLGITGEPAWPTVRTHLLLVAAHGTDPVAQLQAAASSGELISAEERAGVDWRLDDTGHRNTGPGPLPWLPGIPESIPQQALPVCPGKESVLEARRPSVEACCY